MSTTVYLGLGSNIEPAKHIRSAIVALRHAFGPLDISPIYESRAVGFEGDNFLNLVVQLATHQTLSELIDTLHSIEDRLGRHRNGPKFSARTIDIDILLYGELVCDTPITLPRPEITENAYVLKPLCDLAPDLRHPGTNMTYRELWQCYPKDKQSLWPVSLDL